MNRARSHGRRLRLLGVNSDAARLTLEWQHLLEENAAGYARVALANIEREFPSDVRVRKATYPQRCGMHTNSAFGLSRAHPYARERASADPTLQNAIGSATERWYRNDADYPGEWEPSGSDFLSPALVEAELMARHLPANEFLEWLSSFLPGLVDKRPSSLFTPAIVSDSSDGQIAHLHGLNASRGWWWRRLAESLPEDDERVGLALKAAQRHAAAALPHVTGDDYMVEHWLACYAVLLLS